METIVETPGQLHGQIAELRAQLASLETQLAHTKAASKQSEVHFRALFEHSHDSVMLIEPTRDRIIEANDKACQMLGYTREELIAMPVTAIHEADGHELLDFTTTVMERGHGFTDRLTCRTKSGRLLLAEVSASVLHECGECTRLLVSVRNVTEQKQVQTALQQTESLFEALVEAAPLAIVIGDPKGNIQRVNKAFENMLGFGQEDVAAGMHLSQLGKHVDTSLDVKQMLGDLFDGKVPALAMEKRFFRKGGGTVWGYATIFVIRGQDGSVQNIVVMMKDITEHKQALEALKRQSAIIESASDFVCMADMDGKLIYVNPAGMAMVGRAGESFEGLSYGDLLPEGCRQRFVSDIVPGLIADGGVWQGELEFRHRDGHLFPTAQAITTACTENGQPYAVGAIVRDITEVKRFERALEEARDKAEGANRAKSAFLASMSHELRTPLNAILGFSQLMSRDRGLTKDQQDNLTIINRSGEHLLSLINDVLEMSKIEAGRTAVHETDFALHQLLADMEDMFRLRADSKNLTLLFERDESVPEYVHGDEGKLRQILINLISNAIKFTDEGGVTLRIGYQDQESAPRLLFEVEDTGVGIAEDELEHLFEAFVQTRSGRSMQEGTGLGIPISREFVRMLGGELTVRSEVGLGSTFAFQMRARATDSCDEIKEKDVRRVIGLEPEQPEYRILVVEDREENRRLLTRLLRPLGFLVREAHNGAEALEMWEDFSPHLIWMDMRMPVMDGYEATQRIRASTKGQATVIIAITASAFEEDRTMILSAGCDDFVRKPFRENEVYDKMHQHLGVRFVYDEPVAESGVHTGAGVAIDVSGLPVDLRTSLTQATLEADFDSMFSVIEAMRAHDRESATVLAELANSFRYDEILGLMEPPMQT